MCQSKFSDVNERHSTNGSALPLRISRWPNSLCADQLGITDFKATNGLLDTWKKRHNIKQMKVSGESGDVSGATAQSWKEQLPHIPEVYDACVIDETGCFWRAVPDKGLCQRGKECKGDKKCKENGSYVYCECLWG